MKEGVEGVEKGVILFLGKGRMALEITGSRVSMRVTR